jgi:hypothetical protein
MAFDMDVSQLRYMDREKKPLFGGHLGRGEPLPPGSDLERWLRSGWIEQRGDEGYVITEAGRQHAYSQTPSTPEGALKNYKIWIRDGATTTPAADVLRVIENAMLISCGLEPTTRR